LGDASVFDPEAFCYVARLHARLGDEREALTLLTRAIDGGYTCVELLAHDPWLDSIRPAPAFQQLERAAQQKYDAARRLFEQVNGESLLGMR